jgi:fucose permease
LVAELSPASRASALNLLNFSWTLGAVTAPPLFVYLGQRLHVSLSHLLASFAGVVACSAVLVFLCPSPSAAAEEMSQETEAPGSSIEIWLLTGGLLFLYVGVENGIPGWTPMFGLRHRMLTSTSIAYALALYWGSLLLGRLAASFLWPQAAPRLLISTSLITAALGAALIAAATGPAVLYAGLFLAGGGLAAVFPTVVSVFSPLATGRAKAAAGIMFASAGLGGAVIPPLIGIFSTRGYGLRFGLWLTAAVAVVMLMIERRITSRQDRLQQHHRHYRSAEAG